ncbi:MAG: signal peptide peptidase SppA [Myxococcota bacterium]|nr:signal peptide peptidase SppA [Myxococcota bacterium]
MQNPLSILGQLLVSPFRLGLGYLENRLLLKHRALLLELTPKTLSRFEMGKPAFRALNALAQADDLRLLVIRIEVTPKGWASLLAFRSAIETIRASGKSVWVHLLHPYRDGLYLASAADQIFVLPHSALFWNGLGNRMFFYAGMLKQFGVVADIESAGSYKSFGESYANRFPSPENREQLQSIYGSLEQHILEAISEGLKIPEAVLKQTFMESPLSSERAQELGFVHGEHYGEELLEKAKEFVGASNTPPNFMSWFGLFQSQQRLKHIGDTRRQVALVSLKGTVIDQGEGVVISPQQVIPLLKRLREDKRIAAVILKINSPGGSAVASDRIAHAIEQLSFQKPVVALLENVAASGGYYIAARCHEIIAYPTTVTGSIGVVGGKLTVSGALQKLGITSELIVPSSDRQGMFDITQPFSPDQRMRFRAFLKLTYARFLDVVAMGRKLPLEAVASVAEGRVWTGIQALEHKLVDALGTETTALKHAARLSGLRSSEFRVVRMSFEPSLRQKVRSQLSAIRSHDETHSLKSVGMSILRQSPIAQLLLLHPLEALMIYDESDEGFR